MSSVYNSNLFNYCGNDPVNNITKTGFNSPDQVMLQYLSDDSTMLSEEGIKTLNAYSLKGYQLIHEFPLEEKPTTKEEFLEAFNVALQKYHK